MKGTMKFEAPGDGNLNVVADLGEVSLIDKAKIIAGCLQSLEVDIFDFRDVSFLMALAASVAKKANITKVKIGRESE